MLPSILYRTTPSFHKRFSRTAWCSNPSSILSRTASKNVTWFSRLRILGYYSKNAPFGPSTQAPNSNPWVTRVFKKHEILTLLALATCKCLCECIVQKFPLLHRLLYVYLIFSQCEMQNKIWRKRTPHAAQLTCDGSVCEDGSLIGKRRLRCIMSMK